MYLQHIPVVELLLVAQPYLFPECLCSSASDQNLSFFSQCLEPLNGSCSKRPAHLLSTHIKHQENPEKWVGDRPFYPGFKFRDNQREGMSGDTFPADLLNAGDFKLSQGFSRERHISKEVSVVGGWDGCRKETMQSRSCALLKNRRPLLIPSFTAEDHANEEKANCSFEKPFRATGVEEDEQTKTN